MRVSAAIRSPLPFLALAALSACSSDSAVSPDTAGPGDTAAPSDTAAPADTAPTTQPADSAGDSSSNDSSNDSDASESGPDSASDASPADAGPQLRTGFVSLRSNLAPAHTRIVATFLPGGPAYHCPEQPFGDCVFVSCTPRRPADPLPAPAAGVISIAGGSAPVSLSPGADGTYDIVTQSTSLWSGGETLTVSAPGDDVPAFDGQVDAPVRITVTSPATNAADWSLARDADLTVTWTGGTTGEVVVLFGTMATDDPNEVECRFQANAGQGIVPAAALGMLPAGDGYFSVASRHVTPLPAGTWTVRVKAESDAVTSDGALVQGRVVLL
jgi:hypothetical protein